MGDINDLRYDDLKEDVKEIKVSLKEVLKELGNNNVKLESLQTERKLIIWIVGAAMAVAGVTGGKDIAKAVMADPPTQPASKPSEGQ